MFLPKNKWICLLLMIIFSILVSTATFAQICTGPVSGGISVDYDTSGNVYAVRCTTGGDFRIYKSTNGGSSWFDIATVVAPLGSCYPVILTGNTGNKLYLFYLSSIQNGDIYLARFTQSGVLEGSYEVKVGADTITYFSACVDCENGDHLMVAYQEEKSWDATPNIFTITSADYGETWSSDSLIYHDGSHPDIAYGRNGHVYLVFETTIGENHEIKFIRSRDYCSIGSWEYHQYLTLDSYDDSYPKVAALHTLPDSIPYVWVAYNQENTAGTDIDLLYAYSCNGGEFWYKNHILDSSTVYHEMACDLWTKRSSGYPSSYVNVCYFKGRYVYPFPHGHIFYGQVSSTNPTYWGWLHEKSYHWPTQSEDGRKVCQGTYAQGNCAIIWAGKEPLDDPFGDNFQNLWFNVWSTDVEEEMTDEEVPAKFSLSANYPNPFNPVTRIQYTVGVNQIEPVTLRIYNVLGQLVRVLVDEPKGAGSYEVIWNGRDENGNEVASGIYFYRFKAKDFVKTKKMLLLK
jgi:hypothetical protein